MNDFYSNEFARALKPHLAKATLHDEHTRHSYLASEIVYHFLEGKKNGWKPMHMYHENTSHWFIYHKKLNLYIDPTYKEFKDRLQYAMAKSRRFLTEQPSQEAQKILIDIYTENHLWKKLYKFAGKINQ